MGFFRLESGFHLFKDYVETFRINVAMEAVQDFDEPAHVSAFEMVGQIHVHVNRSYRPLAFLGFVHHRNRVGDVFDPYLFNIDAAMIRLTLNVLHNACEDEAWFVARTDCGAFL